MNKSGDYLRTLRLSREINQKHLAGLAGMSVSYLSEIEQGNRLMSHRIYKPVMNALNTGMEERKIMLDYITEDLYQRWVSAR